MNNKLKEIKEIMVSSHLYKNENDERMLKIIKFLENIDVKCEVIKVPRNGFNNYKIVHESFPKNHKYFIINGNDIQYFGCQLIKKESLINKVSINYKGLELKDNNNSTKGLYLLNEIKKEIDECSKILSNMNNYDDEIVFLNDKNFDKIDFSSLFKLVINIKYKGLVEVDKEIFSQIIKKVYMGIISFSNLMNISINLEEIIKSGELRKKIYKENV